MERRQQIKLWLKQVLEKNLSGVSFNAFIFGSQANKATLSRSDIDLGIKSDTEITNVQLAGILSDLEQLPMLYKIDLVNFNLVDEKFSYIALQNCESL